MRYENAILNIPLETGKDALGNEIVTAYEHIPVKVRLTNWTLEERTALDPEYTRVNRKAILHTRQNIKEVESVTIDDRDYMITERIITDRWSILHIRNYKA